MTKTKSKPVKSPRRKKTAYEEVEEAFNKLPTLPIPSNKMPDEISGLFNSLVRMGESYNDRDQRDREYHERQVEADRQLDALALELDYNKAFWKKHGFYPYGRDRYPGPQPEKSKTTLVKPPTPRRVKRDT